MTNLLTILEKYKSTPLTEAKTKVDYRQATMEMVVDNILDAENMLLAALEFMPTNDVEKFLKKSGVWGDVQRFLEHKASEEDGGEKIPKPRMKRKVSTHTRVRK